MTSDFTLESRIIPGFRIIWIIRSPYRWPKGSKRPDSMILADSDFKAEILKGGGAPLQGKIDSVVDLKTGKSPIDLEWAAEVSKRTGVNPNLILEARSGKNLAADFEAARGANVSTRLMGIVDVASIVTDVHHSIVDKLDSLADENPYVGSANCGLSYSIVFERGHFTFLPISYKKNYGIHFWNGPFAGSTIDIPSQRGSALFDQMRQSGTTYSTKFGTTLMSMRRFPWSMQ